MPYIYKIMNDINNKIYIGKTSLPSIEDRFKDHIKDSKKWKNTPDDLKEKRPLYEAFYKYGIEHFFIEKIEDVKDDEEANIREKYWIKKLRTYIGFSDCNGYNATLGGDGVRKYNYKEIAYEYLKLGTVKEVIKKYNCDPKTVRLACFENNIPIKIAPNQQKIQRIDKMGNIKEYASITEAARDIPNKASETARKNISRALNKNGIAYGYKFIYI